ncbi:CRN domain containing hypothetical protein-containing protein [Phytophthora palmivora]|uniref:Uncharacterized protein n=1 Tax=Phytophthora palmivora TaxID=4796 RepID=A0A2P4YVB2_9STRA|nr:CRN domain containing hypothetical protein-containing protein [Phytophthora palmivora]
MTTLYWRYIDAELMHAEKSSGTRSDFTGFMHHHLHFIYSCPTYTGDSGTALVLKDGFLIGIHLETITVLREQIERKTIIKDRLTDVKGSRQAQDCSALLVHEFKNVVSE